MRVQTSLLVFMIFLIILAEVRLSSSRQINQAANEERIRAKFSSTFLRYFSTIPHYSGWEENKGEKKLHTVSRRLVPCGPNPLHN